MTVSLQGTCAKHHCGPILGTPNFPATNYYPQRLMLLPCWGHCVGPGKHLITVKLQWNELCRHSHVFHHKVASGTHLNDLKSSVSWAENIWLKKQWLGSKELLRHAQGFGHAWGNSDFFLLRSTSQCHIKICFSNCHLFQNKFGI